MSTARALLYICVALATFSQSVSTLPSLDQLIEQTPELGVASGYIQKTPELKSFYSALKNATCFITQDSRLSQYPNTLWGSKDKIFDSPANLLGLFSYACVRGVYPVGSFNASGNYRNTFLTDPSISNITGGQVVELVNEGGNGTVYTGTTIDLINQWYDPAAPPFAIHSGRRQASVVVKPDIPFDGGLVHIVDDLPIAPANYSISAQVLGLNAIRYSVYSQNITAVEEYQATFDNTVIVLSNNAYELFKVKYPDQSVPESLAILTYNDVLGTALYSDKLNPNGTKYKTIQGEYMTYAAINRTVFVDNFVVTETQLMSNGILYIVEGFPIPPSAYCLPNATKTAIY